MPNYGDPEYWEHRYREQQGRTFDWLENWSSLKDSLTKFLRSDSKILILGCGNSELGEKLYNEGFVQVWNIDLSRVVIEQMAKRNEEKPEMSWLVMDVRQLDFPSEFFDMALDKSTIDALLCGVDAYLNVAKMTKEVQRVLKTHGRYIAVSYGTPASRLEHFEWGHLHWEVSHKVIGEDTENPHYIYICEKKEGAELICTENWEQVELALKEDEEEDEKQANE